MRRVILETRPIWREKIDDIGRMLGTVSSIQIDFQLRTDVAYEFTQTEVDCLNAATEELHRLCLVAVEHVVRNPALMDRFQIPRSYQGYVVESWERRDPDLMGRFDLAFDPDSSTISMLEYNADTATLAIETARQKANWQRAGAMATCEPIKQFNELENRLLARLREVGQGIPEDDILYFTAYQYAREDYRHACYCMELAGQAGLQTSFIAIDKIGWHQDGYFVDEKGWKIRFLYKLYPWDWMAAEKFGQYVPRDTVKIIEPPWKMILNNKALLVVLGALFPDHPHLLPSSWKADDVGASYVSKPILGREGANISLVEHGRKTVETWGSYRKMPRIYQAMAKMPLVDNRRFIVGSWVVGGRPAGLIVRESKRPIIVNSSSVVPHLSRGVAVSIGRSA